MKTLLNGCSRSEMTVSPSNWKTSRAPIRKQWKIFYRFYDPANRDKYPGGKDMPIRAMNKYKDLKERQEVTQSLLDNELHKIDIENWNPIIEEYMHPTSSKKEAGILPSTPFIQALRAAFTQVEIEKSTRTDMKSVLKYFEMSADKLQKSMVPIESITRGDIIAVLENCKSLTVIAGNGKKRKKVWTYNQFNHYRKYVHILYEYLDLIEVMKYNPVTKIPEKQNPDQDDKKVKRVLTKNERRKVDDHLLSTSPSFHRFVNIFFHSGGRRTEIMRVKGKQVNLAKQRFKVLIKKGGTQRWVSKTIKDIAMPYWIEAMKGCGPEDYVFSLNFQPGSQAVWPQMATRWWKRLVMEQLGINVSFYRLKHLNSTETTDREGEEIAAAQNSHTTTAMVRKIYDVNRDEREHQKLKKVNNSFA